MPFTQSVSRRFFLKELDMIEGSAYYRVITMYLTKFVSFKWWVFWVYFYRHVWLTGSEISGFTPDLKSMIVYGYFALQFLRRIHYPALVSNSKCSCFIPTFII